MKNIKVLEKGYIIDGDVAIITEKVEKTVSLNEFHREVQQYEMEQQRIINQMEKLKTRYDQIEELKNQTRQIISEFELAVPDIPKVGENLYMNATSFDQGIYFNTWSETSLTVADPSSGILVRGGLKVSGAAQGSFESADGRIVVVRGGIVTDIYGIVTDIY